MANCPDICTADKCRELENRIEVLEANLQSLQASLTNHINQDIPIAHLYNPNVDVALAVDNENNTLKVFVSVDDKNDSETVSLPNRDVDVSLATDNSNNTLKVFVAVGSKNDSETITLPKPTLDVDVDVNSLGQLKVTVQLDDQMASDSVLLPELDLNKLIDLIKQLKNFFKDLIRELLDDLIEEIFDLVKDRLNENRGDLSISGSYSDGYLTIGITDGNSLDSVDINIPRRGGGGGGGSDEEEPMFLNGSATFENNILTIEINSSIGSTSFEVEINMDNELLLSRVESIYKILGGGTWSESGGTNNRKVSLNINPETKIKHFGELLYSHDSSNLNELTANNLLDLINIYSTVNYYRNGFHRLPATTLKSLINTEDNNQATPIYDTFSWLIWLTRQVDALVGEFPIKIKHKGINSSGEEVEQDINLDNISVAIAEILALNLGITHDADTAVNIGMKTLVEARNAVNASIVAVDYAQANAQYLGYKGNQIEKEVDCTFTPKASNLRNALKPSTQKIIGWENEDKETLIELIKKTLIGTEIIKAALFHPYNPSDDKVTGDEINSNLENNETEKNTEWEQFKQRINSPSGRYQVPKPKANIRDLTIDEPNS